MKTALSFLFLLLAQLLPAQIVVTNTANQAQTSWVRIPSPVSISDDLGPVAVFNGKSLAWKGPRLGDHTQIWYTRPAMTANQTITTSSLVTYNGVSRPLQLRQWLLADPIGAMPKVRIDRPAGGPITIIPGVTLYEINGACITWRITGSVQGWHLTMYAKTWLDSDYVDIAGNVIWCDSSTTAYTLPGTYSISVYVTGATARLQMRFGTRKGASQTTSQEVRIYNTTNKIVDGFAHPFRGVVYKNGSSEVAGVLESPIMASSVWPDGQWLAFGTRKTTPNRTSPAAFRDYLTVAGTLIDQRPLAHLLYHGNTGNQPVFGATKGTQAANGDPWNVYELLYSSDDYEMRGHHYREVNGSRALRANHPTWGTYSGVHHFSSPDRLGKAVNPPEGWQTLTGGRQVYIDDQHRGNGYLAATYALTGDEMLRESLEDLLAVDETRLFMWNGWLDGTEGARGSGRLWQDWAKMLRLLPSSYHARILFCAERELTLREAQPVTSPVNISDPAITDPRQLPGLPTWVPWNESLMCLGALEMAAQCQRMGNTTLANRFNAFASSIGTTIALYGKVWNGTLSTWSPVVAVHWLAGGAAQNAAYYTFPRANATLEVPTVPAGTNMIVGGLGWWHWYVGGLRSASISGNPTAAEFANLMLASMQSGASSGTDVQALDWLSYK